MQPDFPGNDLTPPSASILPIPTGPEAIPLDGGSLQLSSVVVSSRPRRPEGPGLWESIAWLIGVHVVQAGAALVALLVLACVYLASHPLTVPDGGGRFDLGAYTRAMGPWFESQLATILGLAGIATVLYGAAAVSVRLHRQGGLGSLGLHRPSIGHLSLIVLAVLPLSLLCTELQKAMLGALPHGENDWMQQVFSHLANASFPQILWAIAIAPALGEELICRGLIGRGLIARYGVIPGVLVTSVLFGIMHINPAQAVAVIPLGIAMHFVYLTTRSFWAPVLLHLLNNAFAAVVLKYGEQWQLARLLDEDQAAPWHLMIVSAAMVTALGLLLWQTRVQLARRDGSIVPLSTSSDSTPDGDGSGTPVSQSPRLLLLACGAFNSLGFAIVLWQLATGH